jgi:hypothetical protein
MSGATIIRLGCGYLALGFVATLLLALACYLSIRYKPAVAQQIQVLDADRASLIRHGILPDDHVDRYAIYLSRDVYGLEEVGPGSRRVTFYRGLTVYEDDIVTNLIIGWRLVSKRTNRALHERSPIRSAQVITLGWPFPIITVGIGSSPLLLTPNEVTPTSRNDATVLTLRVLDPPLGRNGHWWLDVQWGGLVTNTTLAAIVLVAFMQALLFTRRTCRRHGGRCPSCGYELRSDFNTGCPECGWNRQLRE